MKVSEIKSKKEKIIDIYEKNIKEIDKKEIYINNMK